MTQQNIIIGTQDAKAGDTLFSAFTKTEANFTDLYSELGQNNTIYLYSEADLPNQTATTWTMNPNVPYKLAASFTTSLQAIPAAGASFRGDNLGSYTLSYTGAGSMFIGTDVDFYINNVSIDPGITATAFEFNDTVGAVKRFICENVEVVNCGLFGIFTDMGLTQINNSNCRNAANGVRFFGTLNGILSVDRLALFSTSAAFKGIDLGTATATVLEFTNLFLIAPAGAFGLSGLANSGNVPVGRLGMLANSEFLGGMDDLENMTIDDIRWSYQNNSPTPNTQPDALSSFHSNAIETVITASSSDGSNAVVIAGVWVPVQASHFTTTVGGRFTYIGERGLKGPVDVSVGLISSGGGGITAEVYLALNGVAIIDSGIDVTISGSIAANLSIPWQLTFSQGDYIEIVVENQSNTTNIIADHAVLRIL